MNPQSGGAMSGGSGGSAPNIPGQPQGGGTGGTPTVPAPPAPVPTPTPAAPTTAGNRQGMVDIINNFFNAANKRDYKAMQGMIDDGHTDHTWFGHGKIKPQAITRMYEMFQDASPDWVESVDDIIAVDTQTGWCVFRATGRGTFTKEIVGRQPDGRQIAVSEIHCIRIQGGKIVEYRQHKHGMFEDPFQEVITAPADVQAARAEQGGSIISEKQLAERERLVQAFASGAISATELSMGMAQNAEPARCQALLPSNFRRCAKPAAAGSIYCDEHAKTTNAMHMV